jgi:16S rRNA (cytosine967-C5)-methyltransferase
MAEQDAILTAASQFVKPGGRLIYVTCSLLAEENEDRVAALASARPEFGVEPVEVEAAQRWRTADGYLRLTPRSAATDGFFVASLRRPA